MRKTITEYVDALKSAAETNQDPEVVRLCVKAAKQQAALATSGQPRGLRFREFVRIHDAFIDAVGEIVGIDKAKAPSPTHFRKRVQETLGLPDPIDFELEEERIERKRRERHNH